MDWNKFFYYKNNDLYWLEDYCNKKVAGKQVGTTNSSGYKQVILNKKSFMVHRIIYEMFKGKIPDKLQIDHIDRNKINNSLDNLRLCTNSENCMNKAAQCNNKYNSKGIYFDKEYQKFRVRIRKNNKRFYLGRFDTLEEATKIYLEAARELHGEFSGVLYD
jgi:hypothetical protein